MSAGDFNTHHMILEDSKDSVEVPRYRTYEEYVVGTLENQAVQRLCFVAGVDDEAALIELLKTVKAARELVAKQAAEVAKTGGLMLVDPLSDDDQAVQNAVCKMRSQYPGLGWR